MIYNKLNIADNEIIVDDNGISIFFDKCLTINGDKHWFDECDRLHRLDGPALEKADGSKEWYYRGERVFCASQERFEKYLKLKIFW